ncbi:hypothetical protein SAMN06296429_10231 [Janibacter indicus]|uniref:Uncharacterized protein n=1 Tax=Janibacter indicus TaxID=857417 RepID=A0A1W1YGS9_9MICO|nr:hypothetical protein SAMN06296429_10231 [Janibacter indicus]
MSRMLRRLAGTTAAVALVAVPILPSQAVTQTTAAAVQSAAALSVTDALGVRTGPPRPSAATSSASRPRPTGS